MPSRRQIRETVVQFLYCAHLEGGAPAHQWRDTFWQLVTESDRRRLQAATARTVTHLAQGRASRLDSLLDRLPQALAFLTARPEAPGLHSTLEQIHDLESRWASAFDQLRRQPLEQADDEVAAGLTGKLDALFALDRALATQRRRFLDQLEDHPDLRQPLEPVTSALLRLQRVSDRLRMVEHPEQFPEQSDITHLRESRTELAELRAQTDRIADAVLGHLEEIDGILGTLIENYAPERIDPVDRAVLRLAAWEILHQPDVPRPVAINEAVEISRRFGSADSPRFVNGILDRIAKPAG